MVRMPMRNQYPSNTATFRASLYDCIKVSVIINRRIDNRRAFISITKNNGVRAWSCHNRGIWGQDDNICSLHQKLRYSIVSGQITISSYAQVHPRHYQHLLEERHEFCHLLETVQVNELPHAVSPLTPRLLAHF